MKHIKTATKDYYVDNMNRRQGESKTYHDNGSLFRHCFYVDDRCHGEFKSYHYNGELFRHCFYVNDKNVTNEVKPLVSDIMNITSEEKLILKLKLGLEL